MLSKGFDLGEHSSKQCKSLFCCSAKAVSSTSYNFPTTVHKDSPSQKVTLVETLYQ